MKRHNLVVCVHVCIYARAHARNTDTGLHAMVVSAVCVCMS